ncbi:putative ribonuclease H-like domain-containing protein [Tanacetum coccineum]|uniref:Ribonuclease H-like domain-containing protein n=1 Tax=Tanacetum coccineum TaxID=301880 RepID=A0ABQ4XGB7_9ASTR
MLSDDQIFSCANEAAGSTAEAHPAPHSPPFSPVRESSPERQPETEWVVPNPVSPGTDWRPWPSVPPPRTPTPPAQTLSFEEPLVSGPVPKPAGYVDPDTIDPIIFGPPPRPYDFVDPALEEPVIFGPLPRPANYIEPEDIDNLNSMEDDTTLGGFHEETHVGPDDAPTTTADAAGRAEDPALLTSLSAKIDRCMGRIDLLETELGTSKKIMGGAILTLVSRVKKLERTVKQLRSARLVGDAPATEGDVDIQDAVDLEWIYIVGRDSGWFLLGVDEVFDLSTPSVFYSDPVEKEVKPLYSTFVKAGEMHAVPPPITGTYMPSPYQSDIEGKHSDNSSDALRPMHPGFQASNLTKDIPRAVDIQTLPSDVEDPNSTSGNPSFSCLENVKSPRIFCNKSGMNNRNVCKNNSVRVKKCFVCGSKLHLIKDCDFYNCVDSVPCKSKAASVSAGSRNSPASVPAGRSDSAASRNRPAVNSAGRPNPAGWSKRPATVSAGRPVSAGWLNPAARPYFRPSSVYFNNQTNFYDPMFMYKGRWDTAGDPSTDNDIGIVDSGCSRSMTGNKEKLDDFVQIKGGIVKFGGGDGRISGKGTIRTSKLDFENVYYVEELQHFNLFSVSQICDKKNKVLFTDTDCLVLSEEFQLPDESQVVLRIPREHDLYTFHISDLQPEQKVTCLVAKASLDESTRWHRRMAHVNFKTINKLAKEGLVDGLPLKVFNQMKHNCVACHQRKAYKASFKHISAVRLITETLQLLHMDLFGPTNIRSIDQKYYSLVVTDDFSRFTWTFYLGTKDETFYVLKEFIALIENQLNKKVKGIRCDNGTEFKNAKLIELCGEKGIKRDYSNPRTPQQNGVAERKNRTLIEAARTMLADSKLPTMFWTEAVSTACYVLNRVSITNPHNKTPYQLISGKVPQIGHLKPFGCQVTILNTSDHLGKFEGKADEGYLVGYAPNSKAYRVYNLTHKRVEETMNLRFLEDKPNVQGIGHEWYFDLDYLTDSLGYTRFKSDTPAGTQETNIDAGTQDHDSDSEVDEQVIVVKIKRSNDLAALIQDDFQLSKMGNQKLGLWYPKDSPLVGKPYLVVTGLCCAQEETIVVLLLQARKRFEERGKCAAVWLTVFRRGIWSQAGRDNWFLSSAQRKLDESSFAYDRNRLVDLMMQVGINPCIGTRVFLTLLPHSRAMDSADSHHESGVFHHLTILLIVLRQKWSILITYHLDVCLNPTSGWLVMTFSLQSDAGTKQIGYFGCGVVVVDKLLDDEIVDPWGKGFETIPESAAYPNSGSRFSESESDDDMETYIPPLPYGAFQDWEIVRCRLFRISGGIVNLLCQSLHSDEVGRLLAPPKTSKMNGLCVAGILFPNSYVQVSGFTQMGKTVDIVCGQGPYPIGPTPWGLAERIWLRHKLKFHPHIVGMLFCWGVLFRPVQAAA